MRKLGVVIFGAGVFEFHANLDNPRFLNSARELRKAAADSKVLAGFHTEVLDLYNKPLSVSATLDKIIDFVAKEYDDIITYYCGHGDVGIRDGDYRVFLRRSNRERRHTLLHVPNLIKDVKRLALKKRVYFVFDSCYSASAVSETMDAGGAHTLIERRLSETVIDNGKGTAVLAASERFGVAIAKEEDELTLFTAAFIRCLKEGIAHKKDVQAFSWLDLKDEVIRLTQDRLGPDAPIPSLMSYSESASDITRTAFFSNHAYVPSVGEGPAQPAQWLAPDQGVIEHMYWRSMSDDAPANVLEDFLRRFPDGTYFAPARALLLKWVERSEEDQLEGHRLEHPRSAVPKQINARLAKLKWDRLKTSTDPAELERFIERFPENALAEEAKRRIDLVRSPPAPEPSPVGADEAPVGLLSGDTLEAQPDDASGAESAADVPTAMPPPLPANTGSSTMSAGSYGTRRLAIVGGVVAVLALIGLWAVAIRSHDGTPADANERNIAAQAAETSRLRKEADSKALAAETTRRRNEADSTALAAVPNDVASLKAFIDRCRRDSCLVLDQATGRLKAAQEAEADRLARAAEAARNSRPVGFNPFYNYDIDQHDIDNGITFNTNFTNCSAKCQSNSDCVAFVFDKWNNACFLKNAVGPLALTPRSNTFVRADLRAFLATASPHTCPYYNSSMHGDISKSYSVASTELCRKQCEADTGCNAYMFRKADRQCSLFSSVSDRTKKDATSDSGERTQISCER
jgi:hypothetical protein